LGEEDCSMKTKWIAALFVLLLVGLAACSPAAEPLAAPVDSTPDLAAPAGTTPDPAASPVADPAEPKTGQPGPTPAARETPVFTSPPADPVIAGLELELDGAVLAFERTGGKMGIGPAEHIWRFYEDGRVVGSDGYTFDIGPDAVAQLLAAIEAQGFFELDKLYHPADDCCDLVTYVVAMELDGRSHQVIYTETAEAPAALPAIIQQLNDLLMGLYE
jgi:hypothetical protein